MELLFLFFSCLLSCTTLANIDPEEDWLLPYKFQHGPAHGNRYVRDCQPVKHGNVTHESSPSHTDYGVSVPVLEAQSFVQKIGYYGYSVAIGHKFVINNPSKTVSVVEPGGDGGCEDDMRETVLKTAEAKHCLLAINSGFFNTTSGACLGDVVSDGRPVQSSGGIQNAHFGIKKDGTLFFGYLTEEEASGENFQQLVGGVIWMVRDGQPYIDDAQVAECSDTEETGSIQRFVSVTSARMAIGHNAKGQLIIVHVDGQTDQRGVDLYELADLLISMGAVNAINLDGGGSTSAVFHGEMVNNPSDECKDNNGTIKYRCPRKVSTVICVHDIHCHHNCHGHGDCNHGNCECHDNWAGPSCKLLFCGVSNCSRNGNCTDGGCQCEAGWRGEECELPCPPGQYGRGCGGICRCANGGVCHQSDGSCDCPEGYTGQLCEQPCPYGYYGLQCRKMCYCDTSCTCHHITGSCNISTLATDIGQVGQCLANQMIEEQHLVIDQPEQYRLLLVCVISLSIIAAVSIILNISLGCLYYMSGRSLQVSASNSGRKQVYRPPRLVDSTSDTCSADDEFQTDSSLEDIPFDGSTKRVNGPLLSMARGPSWS